MKKRKNKGWLLLATFLILTSCSFCQTGYPKVILWEGDTLVAMTNEQVRAINLMKVEHDYYQEYSDSLFSALESMQITIVKLKDLNAHMLQDQEKSKELMQAKKEFIKLLRADFDRLGIKYENLKKWMRYLGGYSILITLLLILI